VPGLNFDKLTGPSAADSELHPRDIFAALPAKKSRYEYLRDVQREVFDDWFEQRGKRDLVIKMNTGNGKTLVGLLLLKSSLNEGAGPAAYLTPDPVYLVDQVEAAAGDLGLSTSRDPRDPAVASGSAILLATVKTLFNGRSKFGVRPAGRKIKLGTVLIDDAHACLTTVEEQFEIRLPASHPAYGQLLSLFEPALRQQQPATLLQLQDEDPYAVMLVPPWDWQDQQGKVLQILHPYHDDDELGWGWPLISDVLLICRCVFTAHEVQIKPPCPPVDQVPSFTQAKRRLYLTATLADDSVLVTHFGADPACVREPITPGAADDIGDRMILAPQEVRPDWSDADIKDYVTELARSCNVVVIVPSASRAEFWRDVADDELYAHNLRDGIDRLKENRAGLVVLVNKYDGVDLPDNACRVLVIDGLPEAYSGMDRIEASALDDTIAMTARQLQRIEQGMGRGIRSRDDYCVVMLAGGRLMRRLHDPGALSHFSAASGAQLRLSRLVAEQLAEGGIDDLRAAVEQCLTRNPGWVRASRNALVGVKYGSGSVTGTAAHQRRAFDLASQQRYSEAADAQQMAVNAAAEPRERGWLKQQLAAYLHPVDPVRAQKQQITALDDNRALLRPRQGIAYVRLTGRAGEQAEAAATFLGGLYSSGTDLLIGVNAILDSLAFDPDPARVDPFEQAVADLGTHLGLVTQRPERDFKRGPDDLWAFGGQAYAVIECKSAAVTDYIRKKDLDQLSGALSWFREQYELPASAVPVMIHPSNKPHQCAAAPPGSRIVTASTLPRLRDAVRAWAAALAAGDEYRNPDAVRQQLLERKLNGRSAIEAYSRSTLASP
jgi:hypothetical protein